MTSRTKAWISDELPTDSWPELCWMHIEGDKLIWPAAVPGGLALCWTLLLEVVCRWVSTHHPFPKAWGEVCLYSLSRSGSQADVCCRKDLSCSRGFSSRCSALTLGEGLDLCAEKAEGWMRLMPPKQCNSEFAVRKLNCTVIKTSYGQLWSRTCLCCSMVTDGCQTGKTAVVR